MLLPEYFTLKELTATATGLPNFPETWQVIENLLTTAKVLDDIRHLFGAPIKVTSGYRSASVNSAIGGSRTSAHRKGLAADIQPARATQAKMKELATICKGRLRAFGLDQVIIYTDDGTATGSIKWVHVGLPGPSTMARNQLLYKKG